jgi:hypothetical protein
MEMYYSDNSGVDFSISLDKRFDSDHELSIIFTEGDDRVSFPKEKLSWIQSCLSRIEKVLDES